MQHRGFGFSGEDSVWRLELVHYTNKLYRDVPGVKWPCLLAGASIPEHSKRGARFIFLQGNTKKRIHRGSDVYVSCVFLI